MRKIVFDLDDFCNENNVLPDLKYLRQYVLPNLKVNLFTIPKKTSQSLLKEAHDTGWIRLVPHGFRHNDNYECAQTSKIFAKKRLKKINLQYFTRGFKAPGWQISGGMMAALADMDWWVAVQWSDDRMFGNVNGPYQPAVIKGLKYYALNESPGYKVIHGHCQEVCGNGLKELWGELIGLPRDSEFEFIDNIVKTK